MTKPNPKGEFDEFADLIAGTHPFQQEPDPKAAGGVDAPRLMSEWDKLVAERDRAASDRDKEAATVDYLTKQVKEQYEEIEKLRAELADSRSEYENLCKFATQYEQERDKYRKVLERIAEYCMEIEAYRKVASDALGLIMTGEQT